MSEWLRKAETFGEDQLSQYTQGLAFPATKAQVVEQAKAKHVPQQLVDQLEKMPDKTYSSIGEVAAEALKGIV